MANKFIYFFILFLIEVQSAIPCDDRCENCTSNECTKCKDGFYMQSNKCERCDPSCKTCETNSNKCLSCNEGKYFDETNYLCIDCIPNCKECSDPRYCEKCNDHYHNYFPNDPCEECPTQCGNCVFNWNYETFCQSCNTGYRVKGEPDEYGNVECEPCDSSSCLKCDAASNLCTQCAPSAILNGDTCEECAKGCLTCKDSTTNCLGCKIKYYKKDNSCLPCPENCEICSDGTTCTSCTAGFFSDNGNCVKCDDSCANCHDDTIYCDKCADGYHFNIFSQCVKCEENCNDCNSTHCLVCSSGYYNNAQGKCERCDPTCEDCTGPGANDCLVCPEGSYLSKSLQKCFKCHPSCATCTGPRNLECSSCARGYFLKNTLDGDTCQKCELGCTDCQDQQICNSCADGFYLTDSNPDQPGDTDKDCRRCSVGCKKCTGIDSCQECLDGFFESSKTNGIVTCSHCPNNCKTCALSSKDLVCNDCVDGYFLKSGKCTECKSPCATCSTAEDKCTSCLAGYLLKGDSCSTRCSSTCGSCKGTADTCTSCPTGFVLIEDKCRRCETGCKTCEFIDGEPECTSCADGYAYAQYGSVCEKCDSTCETCFYPSNNLMCITCPRGYFMHEQSNSKPPFYVGTCSSCSSSFYGKANCIECTSDCYDYNWCDMTCTRCDEGFYLKDNACHECDKSCETCYGSSAGECYTCAEGYYRNGDNCEQCDPSCFGCKDGKCTSCHPKYYLDNGECKECQDPCEECEDRATKCTICKKGYAYNGKCYPDCINISVGFGTNDGKTCHKCDLDQCIKYDDSCQCLECNDGFGAVTDPKTQIEVCVICALTNCKKCTGSEKDECVECLAGYYMYSDQDGKNKVCTGCRVDNCKTCAPGGLTCEVCIDKYYLDNDKKCKPCTTPNCAKCSGSNGERCDECVSGYLAQNGKCEQCTSPCKTCEQTIDHCITCIDGFVIAPGTFKCISNETAGSGCIPGKPCDVVNPNDKEYTDYEVTIPVYDKVENEVGNGGALRVINCNIYAEKTQFTGCTAVKGGGGGVYINNAIGGQSTVSFTDVTFSSCKAQFGGGLYVFSPDERSNVEIINCQFTGCTVLPKSSDSRFFGGSAVYLTIAKGVLDLCTFKGNKGPGAIIKVTEDFTYNPEDDLKILEDNSTAVSVTFNRCTFDNSRRSGSSIFYSNKNKNSNVQLNNCDFKGILEKGAHYIDGSSFDVENSNIHVNYCKFENENAINSKFVKVDFNNDQVKQINFKLESRVLIAMASAALVAIVAITVMIIKRIRNNDDSEMQSNSSELVSA